MDAQNFRGGKIPEDVGYEPPIKIFVDQMRIELNDNILKVVQKQGIQVDSEELFKALQYDRHQYLLGYNEGYYNGYGEAVNDKWISVEDRLPEWTGWYLIYDNDSEDMCVVPYDKERDIWFWGGIELTHWMPLPEPPKEG